MVAAPRRAGLAPPLVSLSISLHPHLSARRRGARRGGPPSACFRRLIRQDIDLNPDHRSPGTRGAAPVRLATEPCAAVAVLHQIRVGPADQPRSGSRRTRSELVRFVPSRVVLRHFEISFE
jgi:hypothetical protein